MPSHQERIRYNCPEINCKHVWSVHANTDIAPLILNNEMRETIKYCMNCNIRIRFVRSQEEFEKELQLKYGWPPHFLSI